MALPRIRHRGPNYLPVGAFKMNQWTWDFPSTPKRWIVQAPWTLPTASNPLSLLHDYALCEDELHRRSGHISKSGNIRRSIYREGGPFYLRKIDVEITPCKIEGSNYFYRVSGDTIVTPPSWNTLMDQLNSISGKTASTWGATGWNKFRPIKPAADLGQFVGELRDFTSMFKVGLRWFNDLGKNYLNYRFGWVPFLRDLQKLYELQKKIEKRIAFAKLNNGKWLRRGGTLKNDASSVTSTVTNRVSPVLVTYFYNPRTTPTPQTQVVTTTDRIWFKAMMRYYIPDLLVDSADKIWTSKLLRKLYGFELTPSVLWELMPWSWFEDWFLNIGDIMSNLSNQAYDNLVAKYAFVMRHRKISTVLLYTDNLAIDGGGRLPVGPAITKYSVEVKERATASQWGFGQLDDDDLSLRQWAILAALGISRVPNGIGTIPTKWANPFARR